MRSSSLALASWFALLAACGGSAAVSSTETTADAVDVSPAPARPEPTDYLPADTYLLVTADVARLRASPYYSTVVETLKGTDEMSADDEELVHALFERTTKVWVAGVPVQGRSGGDVGCIIVEGDYDPGQPEAALRAVINRPEELQEVEVNGHHAIEGGGGILAQLDDRHWIMGPPERVRALLTNPPGGFAASADPAWSEATRWLQRPNAGVTLVALGTPTLQHDLQRESPMSPETAQHVRAAAVALDADDGVFLEAMGLLDDPAVAASLIDWLKTQLDQLASSMIAGMLGLATLLESVDARAEGSVAGVRLTIPDAEVRRLLGLLPNLMQ